ncbi:prolyl-tRNA synthetase [Gracilibacillus boraciitolerans JCM 21714]|uniref:Proline--tRNA ligase n=1 Tax=Gracilibacillus boraciitolerans JCM 21714 TaxID=1298598 RepID=W4VEG0_9BACI|nr:proline--tRNA ligase [Gracilibacillus boraciitolerans]GAE91587.1 prolyl-tRNA synthetase [Gracilibacillus boraciitolerans JCM 21714]
MRQSQMIIPTLKETPADAEIKSHQLLVRAGYIRQTVSGVYSYLPLGNKVLKNIEKIVREEMDKAGSVEMLMPALQSSDLWKQTGRWYKLGPELMRLHDRHDREFALGATHEEVITSHLRDEIKSYKKLPLNVYQIQTKFRDEQRPRFGLLRGREFVMKDAYSFHTSYQSLDEAYDKMFQAYKNIFSRCGLNFRAVIADSGAMGGKDTHEFMVLSEIGEDTIAYSNQSDFAANIEMAPVRVTYEESKDGFKKLEFIDTPGYKTMNQVSKFIEQPLENGIKSLLFKVDDRFVLVLSRGDHEINDIKLKNALGTSEVELATEEQIKQLFKADAGSIGPVNVPEAIEVIADYAVSVMRNVYCGANQTDKHYINANIDRDFKITSYQDLRFIQEGDPSPDGLGTIKFAKGIEVGHVFKLGTFYAEKLGAQYLNEQGKQETMIMGCYGIGVSRTLAAIVEQYNDENGIKWPVAITPYHVHLITVNPKDKEQLELSEKIYDQLQMENISVLFDDRKERPGVKFADSDLIGLPIRITVGKKASEGIVECKLRENGGEQEDFEVTSIVEKINSLIK